MLVRTGVWLGHPTMQEIVTPAHLSSALSYFLRHYAAHGADLVVDYHHASAMAPLAGTKAPAAGWIRAMELRNEGTELWGKVMWVTEAAAAIARREYRYLSPVLRFNVPDRVTGEPVLMAIGSMALTNTPFLTELESLNDDRARDGAGTTGGGTQMGILQLIAAVLALTPEDVAAKLGLNSQTEDKTLAELLIALPARLKAAEDKLAVPAPVVAAGVANALGVAIDATEDAVKAAIIKLKLPSGAGALGVRTALGLGADADDQAVLNAIGGLQQSKRKTDAEELVDEAVKAGKVPPAHREFYMREALHDIGATRMVINSLQSIGQCGMGNRAADGQARLTDDQERVRKLLGVAPETMALGGH